MLSRDHIAPDQQDLGRARRLVLRPLQAHRHIGYADEMGDQCVRVRALSQQAADTVHITLVFVACFGGSGHTDGIPHVMQYFADSAP
jgi:hypothetical protein